MMLELHANTSHVTYTLHQATPSGHAPARQNGIINANGSYYILIHYCFVMTTRWSSRPRVIVTRNETEREGTCRGTESCTDGLRFVDAFFDFPSISFLSAFTVNFGKRAGGEGGFYSFFYRSGFTGNDGFRELVMKFLTDKSGLKGFYTFYVVQIQK